MLLARKKEKVQLKFKRTNRKIFFLNDYKIVIKLSMKSNNKYETFSV